MKLLAIVAFSIVASGCGTLCWEKKCTAPDPPLLRAENATKMRVSLSELEYEPRQFSLPKGTLTSTGTTEDRALIRTVTSQFKRVTGTWYVFETATRPSYGLQNSLTFSEGDKTILVINFSESGAAAQWEESGNWKRVEAALPDHAGNEILKLVRPITIFVHSYPNR